MSGLITALSSIGSIDRTTDVLEIVDVSANTSFKVTVNSLVGISGGSVVSTSDSQSLTNKTLDNTNTLTIKATNFIIQDDSDTSKQAKFVASGITASTTRNITIPDATGTLVLTAATQTLTNKTLTSPTITGGSIDNSTITVDAINGHTTPTIVTVANLQINNGVVGTNGVATASIADTAVTPAKLQSGTGSGWAWSSWTPTFTDFTKGSAAIVAKYIQTGKTVNLRMSIVLANDSSVSTQFIFSLPITSASYLATHVIGSANLFVASTSYYPAIVRWASTTTADIQAIDANSTFVRNSSITPTVPATWATNDSITVAAVYEAA